jgi:hypothetical protein
MEIRKNEDFKRFEKIRGPDKYKATGAAALNLHSKGRFVSSNSATWAVVATVDEPPALVMAFAAWHLSNGAARVYLYFDRPDDPAADLLSGTPGVTVVRCDADHWASFGRPRFGRHQHRQQANATQAYETTDAEFLLHCDADEFLWQDKPMGETLAGLDDSSEFLRVNNVERMAREKGPNTSIFQGLFRKPYMGPWSRGVELFGRDYAYTSRGLTGHSVGKAMTRVGLECKISIHSPKMRGPNKVKLKSVESVDQTLLHFDGLTPLNWVFKLLRKADAVAHFNGLAPTAHREKQIHAILEAASDPAAGMALHDRLKVADETKESELYWLGLSLDLPFDVGPALAEIFPGQDIDLSAEAIDDWLWSQKGHLMTQFGLTRS